MVLSMLGVDAPVVFLENNWYSTFFSKAFKFQFQKHLYFGEKLETFPDA